MNQSLLAELKSALLGQKTKLEKDLASLSSQRLDGSGGRTTDFPQYGDKEDENASEVATWSDNLALETTLQDNLDDVINALDRLKKNIYGNCKYCGQPIDERRLRARPESGACMDCKTKRLAEK